MRTRFEYREEYLQAVVAQLRPIFGAAGIEPPLVRVSCSWAYRGGRSVIGQCFPASMVADRIPQIKISPVLEDPFVVAHVMAHEIIHACRPGAGHGKEFREVAFRIGLAGPMRSTHPGRALATHLREIVAELGPYPHTAIDLDAGVMTIKVAEPGSDEPRASDLPRKQAARLIKVSCPTHGYIARVTRMWLSDMGAPFCPCGEQMLVDLSHPRGGGAVKT